MRANKTHILSLVIVMVLLVVMVSACRRAEPTPLPTDTVPLPPVDISEPDPNKPSGTALHLARTWQARRGTGEIPIHSLRLGGVVGEHRWLISDDEETLQLTHRAHSRRAFLRGVLPAIRFVSNRQNGLYGLTEVLAATAPDG